MTRSAFSTLLQTLDRFRRDPTATSAVEFALILPIMVVLYFGCVEVSEAVTVNRKVTAVSSSVGDLVAQTSAVTTAEVNDIFDAAEAIISPYSTTPLKVVITSVWIDDNGDASVAWSRAQNTTARAQGSAVTIPDALVIDETCLVMTEVDYVYTSVFADFFAGPIPLEDTFYLRPRKSTCVTGP